MISTLLPSKSKVDNRSLSESQRYRLQTDRRRNHLGTSSQNLLTSKSVRRHGSESNRLGPLGFHPCGTPSLSSRGDVVNLLALLVLLCIVLVTVACSERRFIWGMDHELLFITNTGAIRSVPEVLQHEPFILSGYAIDFEDPEDRIESQLLHYGGIAATKGNKQ